VKQGKTSASGTHSSWRRIQDAAAADPTVTAIVLYTAVALLAFIAAYFGIFGKFAGYDDEGTLLITLKAFVHGDPLYKEIWSVYGPFYYELFGGFFKLFGITITTDASRSIVMVLWVGTSLLVGVTAQRLTGRLALGLTAMVAAFAVLFVLTAEPMHPQGLCAVLLAALVFVAVAGGRRRSLLTGAACGALLAALLLTKINLGIFAIAAFTLAAFLTVEPLHRRGWLRWLVMIAFLALPAVVLERDLDLAWVREFLLLEMFTAIAVLIASRPLWPAPREDDGGTMRWIVAAIGGFVVAFVAILLIIVATGPSISDVYDGIVKEAFGIRDVLTGVFPFPANAAVEWGIGSIVAAVLASRLRLGDKDAGPSIWSGALRALAGLTILFSIASIAPLGLNPVVGNPVVPAMVLAWVAVIPPAGSSETPHRRFLRVLIPALAVAESLQVYPVPGSQMGIAAFSFAVVGAICLGDAWVDLRAWSAARGSSTLVNFGATAGVLAVALPALFVLNGIVLPGATSAYSYYEEAKLHLPGAELLHLPEEQGTAYEDLVRMLHEHNCSTFIGYPSVNALYFWSGLESVRPTLPNGWVYALNESQQEQALRELKASSHPCAISNEALAAMYLKGLPAPHKPLVNYVMHDFTPIEEVGGYVFEVPKPSATGG
jgi:hypothetical protein